MAAPFIIRHAAGSDAPVMASLIRQTGVDADASELRKRLTVLEHGGMWIRVAEDDGVVVGLITVNDTLLLHRVNPVARVTLLVVDAEFRGQGIGRSLMHAAEAAARERGARIMEVISNHRYEEAHAFYLRAGYEQSSLKFKKTLG